MLSSPTRTARRTDPIPRRSCLRDSGGFTLRVENHHCFFNTPLPQPGTQPSFVKGSRTLCDCGRSLPERTLCSAWVESDAGIARALQDSAVTHACSSASTMIRQTTDRLVPPTLRGVRSDTTSGQELSESYYLVRSRMFASSSSTDMSSAISKGLLRGLQRVSTHRSTSLPNPHLSTGACRESSPAEMSMFCRE